MSQNPHTDHEPGTIAPPGPEITRWDPRSEEVLKDQIAAYDRMRAVCPIAHSPYGYTSVFRHADVLRIVQDHATYSNAVSRYPSVPNGMDPPEHTPFRQLIEPYFNAAHMEAFAPECHAISRRLVASLPENEPFELMSVFAQILALELQCAWLGWPVTLHEPLRQWTLKNHAATLSRDTEAQAAVAREFDGYIKDLLAARRDAGSDAPDDITTHLLRNDSMGRLLTEEEIVSILRNWTVGELGTIAASIGILVHYLATHPELQARLRDDPDSLHAAIDEILRIHAPLVMNRRVTTKPVELGGHTLPTGSRIAVLWASANRDEAVFGDPDVFRLDRDPSLNLLYGAGVHVCPGAPLARLELFAAMQALLQGTKRLEVDESRAPVNAHFPASGFSSLYVKLRR